MDGEIDFSKYSKSDIQKSLTRIDRQRYPVNFANLERELASRSSEAAPAVPTTIFTEAMSYEELSRSKQWLFQWGYTWRGFVAAFVAIPIAFVFAFLFGPVFVGLSVLMQSRSVITWLVTGALFLFFVGSIVIAHNSIFVRWLFGAQWFGFQLRLVREEGGKPLSVAESKGNNMAGGS